MHTQVTCRALQCFKVSEDDEGNAEDADEGADKDNDVTAAVEERGSLDSRGAFSSSAPVR